MDKSYIKHVSELFEKDEKFCKDIVEYMYELDPSLMTYVDWCPSESGPQIRLINDRCYNIIVTPNRIYFGEVEIVVSKYSHDKLREVIKEELNN